jgi:hypothetical protein
VSVIFHKRVTIYQPSTFSCQSTFDPNTSYDITISKIVLDGYGTSAPTGLEPFGTGLEIAISPGDTSSL